jgi:hypothetical protein
MTDAPRHTGLQILLLLWLAVMAGSVLAFQWTAADGDGFTRGMKRVMSFFGWQLAGLVLALVCLLLRAKVAPGRALRWIALVPAGVALLQVGLIVAAFAAASAGLL